MLPQLFALLSDFVCSLELFQESDIVFVEEAHVVDLVFEKGDTLQSYTKCKSGSILPDRYRTFRVPVGCTIPQPRISIQPDPLQKRQPFPPHLKQVTSTSALGSVNGK